MKEFLNQFVHNKRAFKIKISLICLLVFNCIPLIEAIKIFGKYKLKTHIPVVRYSS